MSQENVEITRRMAEAFNAGGLDAARQYYHPEIEWHEDPSFPESGVYRGIDEVIAYNQQFLAEFEDIRYEGEELAAAGEHVVANMRITGTGKTSGCRIRAVRLVGLHHPRRPGGPGLCATWTRMPPSKPWGCRSRRCRRRTWSWCAASTGE